MLTHLRIQNFKAWRDTGPVRLAPLTVIFGANSTGKSSLGHLLLALQQTARSTDRKRALHLGDPGSLIDLGTFAGCLHGHDLTKPLAFELGWRLPKALEVRDPLVPAARYQGNGMRLDVELMAGKAEQPEVQIMRSGCCAKPTTRRVQQVTITDVPGECFVEFPDAALQPAFDAPHRKFAAVANAHLHKPPVWQAADSKWLDWWSALQAHGVRIESLCEQDTCRFYARKFSDKPMPAVPPKPMP